MKTRTSVYCVRIGFVVLLTFLLSACDSGLKYMKMEIETFPEKLVYYVGEDASLQFDGGIVKLITADGSESLEELRSYAYRQDGMAGEEDRFISSNVNFSVPGEYTVTIHQTKELSCQYVIEVKNR